MIKPSKETYEKHWLLRDIAEKMNGAWSTQEARNVVLEKTRVAFGISDSDIAFFEEERERCRKEHEKEYVPPSPKVSTSCSHCNGTKQITTTNAYTNYHSGYAEITTTTAPCPHC